MTEQVPTETARELDVNRTRSEKMKRNKNARKHGHYSIKAALTGVDLRAIDRRTALGAELARRREQIIGDAGGRENLTELKADLIEKYLRTIILIENVDSYLFQQPCLVRKRNRSLFPVVQQRTQLVDSALRLAHAIGLDRVKRPTSDLKAYLAHKAERKATEHRHAIEHPEAPLGQSEALGLGNGTNQGTK